MWEESLIESRSRKIGRKWYAFPVSVAVHVTVLSVLILSSYWYIEKVDGLPLREPIRIFKGKNPPAYGNELAGHARQNQQDSQPVSIQEREDQTPQIVSQADTNLQAMMEPVTAEYQEAYGSGIGPGSPEGIKGGDPNSKGWTDSFGMSDEVDDPPIIITPEVEQPVLLERVEPAYPRSAILLGLQGYVILQAVITRTGTVEELRILRSDHVVFNNSAIEAVQMWRYRPATINGRPVKVYFTVTVRFELK